MNNKLTSLITFVILLTTGCFTACDDDSNSLTITPAIGFAASEGSVTETSTSGIRIGLYTNVSIEEPVTVKIDINNFQQLGYGTDFTTEPQAENNVITYTIDPEVATPYITIYPRVKGDGKTRLLSFSLSSSEGNGLTLGQPAALTYLLSITPPPPEIVIAHNFNDCSVDYATPAGFIEAFEAGSKTDRGWGCRALGRNGSRAPRASAFGGAAGEDKAWLIMNAVEVAEGSTVDITFWTQSAFSGPGKLNVKWSSNYSGSGDPSSATWTSLSSFDSQLPAIGSAEWKEVKGTFTNISGSKVYLAFQYTEGTSASSSSWDIDDLTVRIK